MFITTKPTLLFRNFFSTKENIFSSGEFFFFARDAIYRITQLLKLNKNDVVLVPCSICSVALIPFYIKKINICFYKIDQSLNADIKDLSSKIDINVKAILFVRYFGVPCNITKVKDICSLHKLLLIEDCALSLPLNKNSTVGKIGDYSIFSIRKFTPARDGACLFHNVDRNNQKTKIAIFNLKEEIKSCMYVLYSILKVLINSFFPPRKIKIDLSSNNEVLDITYKPTKEITNFSLNLVLRLRYSDLLKRRNNYLFFANVLNHPDIIHVSRIIDNDESPYLYPVLLKKNRNIIFSNLLKEGVYCEPALNSTCYDYPYLINPDEFFDETEEMAQQFLGLPIHHNLKKVDLIKIKELILRELCNLK